jgi:hypothetical protein
VQYVEHGIRHTDTVTLKKAPDERRYMFFPAWKVSLSPQQLVIKAPVDGSYVTVDGEPINVGTASTTVWVLPGYHALSLAATRLLQADSQIADSHPTDPFATAVEFHFRLTHEAESSARSAIKDAFQACAAETSGSSTCPQSAPGSTDVHWQLVGDPTNDMAVGIDDQGRPHASGHYLMTYSDTIYSGATEHRIDGGAYKASLTWNGSKFTAAALSRNYFSSQPASRPSSVSDDAIRAAALTKFKSCAGITTASDTDCPQSGESYGASNIHWTLTGDPTTDSTVDFDDATGEFKLKGSYRIHLSYDSDLYGHQETDDSGPYTAHLVWDGQHATCIYING